MANFHGPRIVTDGLRLCLDAGNSRSYSGSGTTWNDLSGYNNDGTLENGGSFDPSNGGAILFDGTDDYVDLGSPPQINQVQVPLTLIMWIKKSSSAATRYLLWGGEIGSTNSETISAVQIQGGQVRYYTNNSSGGRQNQLFNSLPVIIDDIWYFYAFRVSGSIASPTVTVFQNDSSETRSYSALSSTPASNVDFWIGDSPSLAGNIWNGLISSVLWYNIALSDEQIIQNYLATKGRYQV